MVYRYNRSKKWDILASFSLLKQPRSSSKWSFLVKKRKINQNEIRVSILKPTWKFCWSARIVVNYLVPENLPKLLKILLLKGTKLVIIQNSRLLLKKNNYKLAFLSISSNFRFQFRPELRTRPKVRFRCRLKKTLGRTLVCVACQILGY